jgi:uncharacterized protein YdeI (YjbR/CyaY-like superfamily)
LFRTRRAWRAWLAANHDKSKGLWIAYYKKASGKTSVTYQEALEEALAYGWIDSTVHALDEERYAQRYTPRDERSGWSAANKARVARLEAAGLMAPPGLAKVAAAKRNGSWAKLDPIDRVAAGAGVPAELRRALRADPEARRAFDGRPPSEKKLWAYWVMSAKKPETRARRVAETVKRLRAGRRPGA